MRYPAGIYMLKVTNRNTRTKCEISSKLTIKTPERFIEVVEQKKEDIKSMNYHSNSDLP